MKQLLIISASALILFFSCSKENVVHVEGMSEDGRYAMQFSSYLLQSKNSVPKKGSSGTKAQGDPQANPLGDGGTFNMRAWYNPQSSPRRLFYSCVNYSWDNNRYFVSNPTYYWPANGTMDFCAVSPSVFVPDTVVRVTVTDGQTDFLTASQFGCTRSTLSSLVFGHKLNKISFKAIGSDTTLRYQVDSISINVSNSVADYVYSTDSWTNPSTQRTYSCFSSAQTVPAGTSTPMPLQGSLMLLPSQSSLEMTIRFKSFYGSVCLHDAQHTIDLSSSLVKWGINKHLCYTFVLGAGDVIVFSAESDSWADGGAVIFQN